MDIRVFFGKGSKIATLSTGGNNVDHTIQEKRLTSRNGLYICKYCGKNLNRSDSLKRHLNRAAPCHPSHPNYKTVTHCIYCNKWEYDGKTKSQIIVHKTYCKRVHNGVTYHDRERKRLEEFESKEIKLMREQIEMLKEENKQIKKKVEEPRSIIVQQYIDQVNIDKVYANMVPMVSSRMQALFNSSKTAIKYFDAWADKREDLELLAKDQRTDSFQADTLSDLALRIGANALHAADLGYLVDQESGNITVTRDANGNRIEQTISLEEFQMKVNRTSLNSIGEIDYMDDFDDINPSLSKKENKAMKEFAELEGIDHTILTEKSEGMIENVLLKKKRYVEASV